MKNILVIGDTHIPFVKNGYLDFCLRIYKQLKCEEVVHIGDLVDLHSCSYHEHSPDGFSPIHEMEKADKILKDWFSAFPKLKLCRGNHDCYDEQTEILTKNGWKLGINLTKEDVVATLNINNNCIEYQKPILIINKKYFGEMMELKDGHSIDMLVTPSHRMLISSKETKISEPIYCFKKAHTLNNSYRYYAVSGINNNLEYNVSDNELMLLGWIYTDGGLKDKKYCIYQSKIENLEKIRQILKSLNINFIEKIRNRNITEICGKKLLKPPLPQHEFHFKSSFLDKSIFGNKKILPSFIWDISKRQFDVFFNSVIDGDGTSMLKMRGIGNRSYCLHGEKQFLDQIQSLCIQNGYHASMRVFRKKDFRLNIVKERFKVGSYMGVKIKEYDGFVWCATVPNSTLVVRRNGNVQIHGNCLIDRKGKTAGLPSRCFKKFRDTWNLPVGWIDDFQFLIDGVLYTHGVRFGKNAHLQTAQDNAMSTVVGHSHAWAGVQYWANEKQLMFGMNVGCGIDRKSYAFDYGKGFANKPIISCGVVSYVKKGINATVYPMELT